MMKTWRIALYGQNGHQLRGGRLAEPAASIHAVAGIAPEALPPGTKPLLRATLDELLADPDVDIVSLCSPVRATQADDAIRCLRAGKHVLAEKPCALSEADLDRILEAVAQTGMTFHEMGAFALEQPYLAMRDLVRNGSLGDVVQVLVQKSYPYHERRPQDERIDGGLLLQVGVHAARFVERVAGRRIVRLLARETGCGNPGGGALKMAAAFLADLDNGGLAAGICNYLNPRAFPAWGNDHLRIFGTRGFVECTDGGEKTRMVLNDKDCGPIDISAPAPEPLAVFLQSLTDPGVIGMSLEEELHPLRMLLIGKAQA